MNASIVLTSLIADMQVTLIHRDPVVFPSSNRLTPNKPISLGRSADADLRISGDAIADIQFTVQFDGRVIKLRNLAPNGAKILVNDAAVHDAELRDGDVVTVGNTRVEVLVERPAASAEARGLMLPPSVPLTCRELPTGLVAYEDATREISLDAALTWLSVHFQPLLLANFEAAGQDAPAWLSPEENLLKAASPEQIGKNCLYLLAPGDVPADGDEPSDPADRAIAATARLLKVYHALRPYSAAVLLFGNGNKQEVDKAIGFRRGFYASATCLELFLRQGSVELARGLIEGLHAIVIAGGDASWTAYANPKLVHTAADLNLAG